MNIRLFVVSAFTIATLASCGGGEQAVSETSATETPIDQPAAPVAVTSGKYKIKSGIIHLETEGFGMKTKKVVYFDDFGSKERSEVYETDGSLKEVMISDGESRHTLIPKDKSAYFVDKNGSRGWEMEFAPWEQIQKQKDYEEDYKKAPNMTIAGKDCESYVYGKNNTFAGWNGLTLFHQQGSSITIKAVSLEENVAIEADKFTVPADYTVKKAGV